MLSCYQLQAGLFSGETTVYTKKNKFGVQGHLIIPVPQSAVYIDADHHYMTLNSTDT